MTDRSHPLSDEDVSAVADGRADHETASRVHAEAADRLAAVEAARHLLATTPVPPLGAPVVDDLVRTALAARDDEGHDTDEAGGTDEAGDTDGGGLTGPDGATTVSASAAPAAPPRRSGTGVPLWLVAAAVVAMMAVGIGLIRSGRTDDTAAKFETVGSSINVDDEATAESSSSAGASAADRSGASTTAAAGAASAPATVTDLGTFADADALRTALARGFGTSRSTRSLPSLSVDRCRTQAEVTLSLEADPTLTGLAEVAGRDVLVYVFPYRAADHPEVTELVVARGRDACDPVLTFQR